MGLVGDAQEARGRPRGSEGSLEAVEDLALQAMLDLAAPQHELQDLVDGVLRVFLWTEGQMQERVSPEDPQTPHRLTHWALLPSLLPENRA